MHGGTVYDTQTRLPFVAFGPIARGMLKRVPGVWSDTAIAPTLLEALGVRHRDCRSGPPAQHQMAGGASKLPLLATPAPGMLGVSDLFGCSVLSSPAPRHAMVSCAFDSTCVGLVTQLNQSEGGAHWKFASYGGNRLEAYLLDADMFESTDQSGQLPEHERMRILSTMHTWLHAVHEFWLTG